MSNPKVLIFDVETSYLEGVMWDIWEQNFAPNQLKVNEWSIIAYSAKWLHSDKVLYADNRKKKNKRDDKQLVQKLRDLLDEADIIITKNGKRFDEKMFNARCAKHGIHAPSTYRHIDVERIVRRRFKLVSYSLEYLCYYFKTKHKKLKHGNYPGMVLWTECMKGNQAAWREMEDYNKHDVLCTEELYHKIKAWDNSVNYNVFHNGLTNVCDCGSNKLKSKGYAYSNTGKYKRFICIGCGKNHQSKLNELDKEKRKSLLK